MPLSQRERQRARRERARERGNAAIPQGKGLSLRFQGWLAELTRGDLVIIRRAVNEGWLDDYESHAKRAALVEGVMRPISGPAVGKERLMISSARTLVVMDLANLAGRGAE